LDFEVTRLEKIFEIYPRPKYILTADTTDARVAAKNFPNSKVLSVEKNNSEKAYQAFMNNLLNLKTVYESLIDEESRRTFRGYWLGNISNQLSKIVHSNNPHYLTPGFIPKKDSIVIDAGSFDGGTPTRFVERGFKVYGFEMDKRMFQVAKKVSEQKNFVLENMGLGSYQHTMKYVPLDSGSTHLDEFGTESALITTIDSYVREKNLPSVDFIKLDVEGAELDVLKGAAVTICRFKPILAISAYHKWDDFWTLMNFVKSIRSDYEFAMRQYHVSREDEPFVFREGFEDTMSLLGLDICYKNYNECCLLAR